MSIDPERHIVTVAGAGFEKKFEADTPRGAAQLFSAWFEDHAAKPAAATTRPLTIRRSTRKTP